LTKTEDQFIKEIAAISPSIEIIGHYTKAVERVKVRCRICGKEWEPKAYSLSQGKGCPHCSAIKGASNNKGRTGRKTQEDFIKELSFAVPDVEVQNNYVSNKEYYDCRCKCQFNFVQKVENNFVQFSAFRRLVFKECALILQPV